MTGASITGAIDRLLIDVQRHYGDRLAGLFRLDRRGILEDVDQTEAELVVILKDGPWRALDEMRELARLAFEVLMETGIYIRVWPVTLTAWNDPSAGPHPDLVREFKRHAGPIREAA